MSNKAEQEKKLKVLQGKKESLFRRIQNLYDVGNKIESDPKNLQNFKIRYTTLEKTVAGLDEIVTEINELNLSVNEGAVPDFAVLDAVDELYAHIECIAKKVFASDPLDSSSTSKKDLNEVNKPLLRLPKIEIKGFDGNPRNWPVFYQIFDSMINQNKDLSDSEKVHYLVGKLSGKALTVCAGIPPIAQNYSIIYNSLIDKYQDQRYLASSYLEQIINFKRLNSDNSSSLNSFLDTFDASVSALKNLNFADLSDFVFVYLTLDKLPADTVKAFEMQHRDRKLIPKYSEVIQFVKDQSKINTFSKSANVSIVQNKSKTIHSFYSGQSDCLICNRGSHLISSCRKFLNLSPFDRFKLIKDRSLCLLCFSADHKVTSCGNRGCCKLCKGPHHDLLHFIKGSSSSQDRNNGNVQSDKPSTSDKKEVLHSLCSMQGPHKGTAVLLSTVVVHVVDNFGSTHKLRFLLDGGSQSNFLCTHWSKQLALNVSKKAMSVNGIGNISQQVKGITKMIFSSRFASTPKYSSEFYLIDQVTDKLPALPIEVSSLEYLKPLELADDNYHLPGSIDGILGANAFAQIVGTEKISGPENCPVAIETSLGYVVMGKAPVINESFSIKSFCSLEPLEAMVSRFFELEDVPSASKTDWLNKDDQDCEEHFKNTYRREPCGRFVVSLPFKEDPSNLGDSYDQAKKRFLSLERKLVRNPELRVAYDQAMADYLDQGHILLAKETNLDSSYVIPHHAVYKESSSTPLRIVFDAGMKTSSSVSLNDILHTGPKLQLDIFELLLNFRLFPIALSADLRQMYRQIKINPDHRQYQRLLWRFSPESPLDVYELSTVVFGVKSSPYLALRTVHQLADDEAEKFPDASQLVKKSFYMDDLVYSVEDENTAKELCRDLISLFAAGGFQLVKWASNSMDVLDNIPIENRLTNKVEFENDSFKILGLEWCPRKDNFSFSFRLDSFAVKCTKRNILSLVARFFDPLGILAPVIMFAKLLVRECWKMKLDWDSTPPVYLQKCWDTFCGELKLLFDFEVPRHIGIASNEKVTLIGFADSSEKGLGTVIYLRSSKDGLHNVRLVCAKSKVSPLKAVTIPRLELCAAVMLTKLVNFVMKTISDKVVIERIIALSDSMVVVNWIHASSTNFKTFVANRISKIQEVLPAEHWFHVAGKDNMADDVSRGLTPSQFLRNKSWSCGPSWLSLSEEEWPIKRVERIQELPEQKVVSLLVVQGQHNSNSFVRNFVDKFSSWTKLVHVLVYVFRFSRILPNTKERITAFEIEYVENRLILFVQETHFKSEIGLLQAGRECSNLKKLRPFLNHGIIRVGGRLANADLLYDQKHPVLLPKKDHLVNLIIDNYHRTNFHCGPNLLLGLLRQRFWILSARSIVRKRVHSCNFCFRFRPKSVLPVMGELPAPRVNQAKAFLHTGVDFAGPYKISMSRYRGNRSQKAYICLFICLSTKAVHLELASDLSTPTFLSALKRFLSRRGPCSVFYSDCGTNFIGAKGHLDEIYQLLESSSYQESLKEELLKHRIEWKFNPPKAPHFGGLWESNIKSCKNLLAKAIGEQLLTYEEFSTVLIQIESLLNSRPLYCLSSDPSEPEALTPAHFLTLSPLKYLPAPDLSNSPHLVCRKLLLDKIVQSFWNRWHIEYLTGLQVRAKWNSGSQEVKLGTVVVLMSEGAPPLRWPLGVIEELYPGKDSVSRVALVRTKSGSYKRPLVKLCPLPTQ